MTNLEKTLSSVIAVLLCLLILFWNKNNRLATEHENGVAIIKALRSTVQEREKKDGTKEYVKQAPVAEVKDIVNSLEFERLTKQQQQFYRDLQKAKGVIAASQAIIRAKDSIIGSLSVAGAKVNDSDICYALGQPVTLSDSTAFMKWNLGLVMNQPLKYTMTYDYRLKVHTKWTRNKDESVDITYSFDDPAVSVADVQGFKVPAKTEGMTKLGKFFYENRRVVRIVAASALFAGGYYVGTH